MVNPIRSIDTAAVSRRLAQPPGEAASAMLSAARGPRGVDTARLAQELSALEARSPARAAQVRQQLDAQLSPVDRGRLAGAAGTKPVDLAALSLDLGQIALDVVGIFEPTPFADLTNAGISVLRGDGFGAITSAAGALPYVGDLAKLGKLGKWAQTVANAVEATLHNPAARRALEPALKKLGAALNAIPDSVMSKLPADAQAKLKGLRAQIDRLASPVAREVGRAVDAAADRLGIAPDRLRAVLDRAPGSRPAVSTYMSAAQQARHLANFDGGIVRVTSRTAVGTHGTLGPPGGFVTSVRDFRAIMAEAKGDLGVVERRLGLDRGTLGKNDTLIAVIDRADAPSLRLPTGNEGGANTRWTPGGYTSQNTVEAVMDFKRGLAYNEIKLK